MRGKTTNVIELKGKLYDAHTGKPVGGNAHHSPAKHASAKQSKPRSVDGFGFHGSRPTKPQPKPIASATSPTPKPKVQHSLNSRPAAGHMKHGAQKSQTLNRKSVKAPLLKVSSDIMPHAVKLKEDVNKRLERAMQVSKSSVISRFPSPAAATASPSGASNISNVPKPKPAPQATLVHEKITKSKEPMPTVKAPIKPKKQKRSYKKHFSWAAAVITGLALLAVISYLVYLNVPAVSMKVAASRAGFPATLPSYTPQGYRVDGPAVVNAGLVTIHYKSSSNGRSFVLSEQSTNWDPEALKENYVDKQTSVEPITQQYNGITVYLYEGKASWVSAGKLFTIDTNGSQLGVDQILKLAASV